MRPATAHVEPLEKGGVELTLVVPTYSNDVHLAIRCERDAGGDWVVSIPWPATLEDQTVTVPDARELLGKEVAFTNGIAYFGAPDEDEEDELE